MLYHWRLGSWHKCRLLSLALLSLALLSLAFAFFGFAFFGLALFGSDQNNHKINSNQTKKSILKLNLDSKKSKFNSIIKFKLYNIDSF